MKEEIKSIILEYCEGISFLEFDADKLDEISERIEQLSKLHQPTVSGRSEQFYCASDKDNRHERCDEQCHLCKMDY